MTKKQVEDALDCVVCYQDESLCEVYREFACNECMGYQKAIQILIDFVEKMVGKLEEES